MQAAVQEAANWRATPTRRCGNRCLVFGHHYHAVRAAYTYRAQPSLTQKHKLAHSYVVDRGTDGAGMWACAGNLAASWVSGAGRPRAVAALIEAINDGSLPVGQGLAEEELRARVRLK